MIHDLLKQAAKDAGYNDAKFDGMYLPEFLECQCDECRQAYEDGQDAAFKEFDQHGLVSPKEESDHE